MNDESNNPRALDRLASRRAWGELSVRRWWLAAAAVLAVCLYIALTQWTQWRQEVDLLRSGTPVSATVLEGNNRRLTSQRIEPTTPVKMQFTLDAKTFLVEGVLAGREQFITPQEQVTLHVRADNPNVWTGRQSDPALAGMLTGALLPLGLFPLLLGAAWLARRRVLGVYQLGQKRQAVIVRVSRSPLAPRSQVLGLRLQGTDNRLYPVLWRGPMRAAGQTIDVLHKPQTPGLLLAAGDYLSDK